MASGHRLTLAICTYNRADLLRVLLENLVQVFDSPAVGARESCDVLVVDNHSTDHTADLLQEFASNLPLTMAREERQGLAYARNRALRCFSGDAILFLDDDVSIDPESVAVYLQALDAFPQYDYFGGPIDVDWQDNRPRWLKSNDLVLLNGLFGQYRPSPHDLEYSEEVLGPYGANFLLRRRLCGRVEHFDTRLGVRGNCPGRGEETDYFLRARRIGARGLYLHEAAVRHRFQTERLNITYLYRYGIAKGKASGDAAMSPGGCATGGCATGGWATGGWATGSWAKEGRAAAGFLIRGLWQLARGRVDRFYQCIINIGIIRGRSNSGREP